MGRNGKKACKRRLSMLTNSMSSMNSSVMSETPKHSDCLEEQSTVKKDVICDTVDVGDSDIKRKFFNESSKTPQLQFRTPVIGKPTKLFAQKTENQTQTFSNQLVICNSFVYATCRDALNEDLNSKIFNLY